MSYGHGPLGYGPLGTPAPPPLVQVKPPLYSSRKIDGVTKSYVTTAEGNFAPMDDTDQRVLLVLCYADVEVKVITPQSMRDAEQKLRDALVPLTDERAPAIKLIAVAVTNPRSGVLRRAVKYHNLLSNTTQTVAR